MNFETAKRIAGSRNVVGKPGKYIAKVIAQPNPLYTEDIQAEGPSRYLVNTNLMSNLQANELRTKFQESIEEGVENFQDVINGSNLVGSLNFGGVDGSLAPEWIPTKGEYVHVMVDYVNSNRRATKVLAITSVTPIPVENTAPNRFSFDNVDEEVPSLTESQEA